MLLLFLIARRNRGGGMSEIKTREGEAKNCARMIHAATSSSAVPPPIQGSIHLPRRWLPNRQENR